MEESRITSKQMLNDLMEKHYNNALEAKKEGRPVVWATSISPQELLETMDLTVVYPENHAAAIGARKEAMRFIEHSEGIGYSSDICSYARVNMGYIDIQESKAQNIPMPDMIFCCSNICNTVIKWYENIARKLNIPIIMFDMPFNHTYDAIEQAVTYMRGQIEEAIIRLEDFTGRRFDYDRFSEVMKLSNETATWWKKATEWAKVKPSPLNGFDMFNYMAPIVCMRGSKEGHELFKLWYEELEERVAQGLGPWSSQEERYRILWDGIACWPHLATTFKTLKKYGVNVVTSTYPDSWYKIYETNDLDGMARAYTGNYVNRNLDYGGDNMVRLVREYQLDGVVFHSNRSCKLMDFRTYEIQRRITEQTGCPSVLFDGDQTDPRVFSEAQYETRIQALVEMMEKNKEMMREGDI